jgi:hypothetical protein
MSPELDRHVHGCLVEYGARFGYSLEELRGAIEDRGPLTEEMILSDCDAFYALHGEWPKHFEQRPVPQKPRESWQNYTSALTLGWRGLPGGSSLARLLENKRGARNRYSPPTLTRDDILQDADKFHRIHGEYPSKDDSRPVPGKPHDTWNAYEQALRKGRRGLLGGTSLAQLLAECRNRPNRKARPRLTEAGIWADAKRFRAVHGEWPSSNKRESVPDKPNDTWSQYQHALRIGLRGLPGGSSLAKLIKQYEAKCNKKLLDGRVVGKK